jgi:hypothetical protein
MPSAVAYRGRNVYTEWLGHLEGLAERAARLVNITALPIQGCNVVLIGRNK